MKEMTLMNGWSSVLGSCIGFLYAGLFFWLHTLSKKHMQSTSNTSRYPVSMALRIFLVRCLFFIGCLVLLWYYQQWLHIQWFCCMFFCSYVVGLMYVLLRHDV